MRGLPSGLRDFRWIGLQTQEFGLQPAVGDPAGRAGKPHQSAMAVRITCLAFMYSETPCWLRYTVSMEQDLRTLRRVMFADHVFCTYRS